MGKIDAYEEKRKKVQEFTLTSDVFAGKVFEKPQAFAELLKVLLQREVKIKEVHSQYVIRNMESHSVILDLFGESESGEIFHLEIQNNDDDNHVKRMRYYESCIEVSLMEKGTKYRELPKICQIFISKNDFARGNRPIYMVRRTVGESGVVNRKFDDERTEIYFNLTVEAESEELRELQRYFMKTDPEYKTKYFPEICKRVYQLKCSRKGVDSMCEITDKIRRDGIEQGVQKGIRSSILYVLKEHGKVPSELENMLDRQKDEEILYQWLSVAVHCQTPKKFMKEINVSIH